MKHRNTASDSKASRWSSYLGIAFGTAVAFGTGPALSALGIAQNESDVADQWVRQTLLYHPDLSDRKPVLHDLLQGHILKMDAVKCYRSFPANYCFIKGEKLFEMAVYASSLAENPQTRAIGPKEIISPQGNAPKF